MRRIHKAKRLVEPSLPPPRDLPSCCAHGVSKALSIWLLRQNEVPRSDWPDFTTWIECWIIKCTLMFKTHSKKLKWVLVKYFWSHLQLHSKDSKVGNSWNLIREVEACLHGRSIWEHTQSRVKQFHLLWQQNEWVQHFLWNWC